MQTFTELSERIEDAAWKDPRDGKIYTGQDHYSCWCLARSADKSVNLDDDDPASVWAEHVMRVVGDAGFYEGEGFVTDAGRFVDREEALSIAKRQNQVNLNAANGLRAEELVSASLV